MRLVPTFRALLVAGPLLGGVSALARTSAAEDPGAPAKGPPRLVLEATWRGPASLVRCLAVHPTGRTVAAGSSDRALRLWDVATGKVVESLTLPPGDG